VTEEERALMPPEEAADGNTLVPQPHCEIAKTILDEECERPGEVRYWGMLLCGPHAELLGLEHQAEALLGSVFLMDEWMEENGDSAADDEFVGRIMREREEAVGALRLARAQLRSARKALSVGR
jgi:hypothetical protein